MILLSEKKILYTLKNGKLMKLLVITGIIIIITRQHIERRKHGRYRKQWRFNI